MERWDRQDAPENPEEATGRLITGMSSMLGMVVFSPVLMGPDQAVALRLSIAALRDAAAVLEARHAKLVAKHPSPDGGVAVGRPPGAKKRGRKAGAGNSRTAPLSRTGAAPSETTEPSGPALFDAGTQELAMRVPGGAA